MIKKLHKKSTASSCSQVNNSPEYTVNRFKAIARYNSTNNKNNNNNNIVINELANQSIANMVERFVQSISNVNDSGTFDTSLEVKHIQSPQRIRHRCVTELDRKNLMKFVREFEARQQTVTTSPKTPTSTMPVIDHRCPITARSKCTPKSSSSSPSFCQKLLPSIKKSINLSSDNATLSSISQVRRCDDISKCDDVTSQNSSGMLHKQQRQQHRQQQQQHQQQPVTTPPSEIRRGQNERSSLRSAVKVLQFLSPKKKSGLSKEIRLSSSDISEDGLRKGGGNGATSSSPVRLRDRMTTYHDQLKHNNYDEDVDIAVIDDNEKRQITDNGIYDECDDGISSAGSNFTEASTSSKNSIGNNTDPSYYSRNDDDSPDSSFEMHAPLVPSFKVTPPPSQTHKLFRNPASEFARFIRGSFHAKRASITKLRRSISDPDNFEVGGNTGGSNSGGSNRSNNNNNNNKNKPNACKTAKNILKETTNFKHSEDQRNRALSTNASPFRRVWGQTSLRTSRTDKHQHCNNNNINNCQQFPSPLVRRTASMNASDHDVYIKSMDNYLEELKQTKSQQQIFAAAAAAAAASRIERIKSKAHVNFGQTTSTTTPATTATHAITSDNAITEDLTEALTANDCKSSTLDDQGPVGVAAWGTSFERLLEDPAGLQTFAEFLKKEFSAENIYFWTACERFRHLENESDRADQAMTIFAKHLANGSSEPVNVDSQARNLTEEKLKSGERDIFAQAQKQIFNLMKFDSYQRFIRSDMYKNCLEAEAKNLPLPYTGDDLDELLKTNCQPTVPSSSLSSSSSSSSKLKKSASNAEDRRRKSLLPWHRKTRCKSRDRTEDEVGGGGKLSAAASKLPQLSSSNSLKIIPSAQNSTSDVHSSRSSLSSFDALPGVSIAGNTGTRPLEEIKPCSLCRVILSDGATTIVQTRSDETVGQLVERLLEKRGLTYPFYDVVISGCTKSIDPQSSAMQTLAGKEVLIEQRVAFKLDLPDPKVISVKSKPKKQLHEVIRPILQKYNYCMDTVQVLMRDTREQIDLSLPVTVANGHRLQVVLTKGAEGGGTVKPNSSNDYQNGLPGCSKSSVIKHTLPKSVSFPNASKLAVTSSKSNNISNVVSNPNQSTLDEITNKVFNELLQSKVETHSVGIKAQKQKQPTPKFAIDECSLNSDDCTSEASSKFDRRHDSNIARIKAKTKKSSNGSSSHSDETININSPPTQQPNCEEPVNNNNVAQMSSAIAATSCIKKPIIAKLKAGVKLQVTERVAENQDALLEGLKRAQLARLEDQRGTEINIELPDFLKNKENLSAASKLRKVRANLSPVNKSLLASTTTIVDDFNNTVVNGRPQPAPRLSITNKTNKTSNSPHKIDEDNINATNSSNVELDYVSTRGPPPLPPKPKVLPIKPSNWGAHNADRTSSSGITHTSRLHSISVSNPSSINNNNNNNNSNNISIGIHCNVAQMPSKIPIDINRKLLNSESTRCAYLEEPSSSFV